MPDKNAYFMRYLVMLFILLSLSCGDDTATSPGGGSVDKADLIPGEYEGFYITTENNGYFELTATFTDSAYAFYSDVSVYCFNGDLTKNFYTVRGDTLICIRTGGVIGACTSPFSFGTGAYIYTHDGDVMTLRVIGTQYPPNGYYGYEIHQYLLDQPEIYYLNKKEE